MQKMHTFEDAYKKLNAAQKDAVDTIEGPVMVIAGPGTGKTQILTLRIANILRSTDTQPENILALTFTDAGVKAMRERLARFMGGTAYQVHIHTYHSFAELLVHAYGDHLERLRDGQLVDEVDQREVLEAAFDACDVPLLSSRMDPYRGLGAAVRFIQDAKREYWNPESLREAYKEKEEEIRGQEDFVHEKGAHAGKIKKVHADALAKIEKNMQAVAVYEEYEKLLHDRGLYDFQDLLIEVAQALKHNEELKQYVQETYQYLLADEHQDANAVQNEILLEIADFHESPNIFVVGDEKQAIFRFQGADLDTFLTLRERYPDTKVIALDTNYRSTQEILDTAHELIAPAPIPDPTLRKELEAHHGSGIPVRTVAAYDREEELGYIVAYIQKKIEEGAAPEDVAVLVRTNAQAFPVAAALDRAGITYTLAARENVLDHPFAQVLLALLRGVTHADVFALARGVFTPGLFKTPQDRLYYVDRLRDAKGFPEDVGAYAYTDEAHVVKTHAALQELHELVHTMPVSRAVPQLIAQLGVIEGISTRPDAQDMYSVLEALLSDIESFTLRKPDAVLAEYLERIERIKKHDLSVLRSRRSARGVQILTAHGAKGLEFPYVLLPFMNDRRKRGEEIALPSVSEQEDHDERRLLYVALTRAEKEALVTYAKEDGNGRELNQSKFLYDIEAKLTAYEGSVAQLPLIEAQSQQSLLDTAFLESRLKESGISATAYGNYRTSPWKYFFRNLLRIPEGTTYPLMYGSAIHAALEHVGECVLKGKEVSSEDAYAVYAENTAGQPLTEKEQSRALREGKEVLERFITQRRESFPTEGFVEHSIRAPFEVPGLGEIELRGKLDRIDVLDGGRVRVVDYKTGKPKSENEIRGITGDDPSYYVQLLFYAVLLKHDPAHEYHMSEGVFEFVEPNPTGKLVQRTFSIDQEELDAFEAQLRTDLADIAQGAFVDAPCEGDYAELATLLRA